MEIWLISDRLPDSTDFTVLFEIKEETTKNEIEEQTKSFFKLITSYCFFMIKFLTVGSAWKQNLLIHRFSNSQVLKIFLNFYIHIVNMPTAFNFRSRQNKAFAQKHGEFLKTLIGKIIFHIFTEEVHFSSKINEKPRALELQKLTHAIE